MVVAGMEVEVDIDKLLPAVDMAVAALVALLLQVVQAFGAVVVQPHSLVVALPPVEVQFPFPVLRRLLLP